jgi:hypothetical protein
MPFGIDWLMHSENGSPAVPFATPADPRLVGVPDLLEGDPACRRGEAE